ncbi:MAG TPA: biotin--[acetyl-CoA-carboxylase] ligase [Anaerolineae bacterium]|nr:biotin--[acetyl-CoA-carboxylase] ligase [Anaerolineae bacterium]
MSRLSGDLVRHQLPTYTFGQNVVYIEQTGSTNTELKRLARWGAPEGLLYLTDEQLTGRGRLERSWHAPAESSLLMSLLFRPGSLVAPHQAQRLTMLCALALADAIELHTELSAGLKWPNDLVWDDGKKLAGILTELDIEGDEINWAVVGLGLNVNVDFSRQTESEPDRPGRPGSGGPPLAQTATSLSMIMGRDTGGLRLPILQSFLFNVEQRYEALRQGKLPHREWQERLVGIGQPVVVTVLEEAQRYEGRLTGVDENGAILLTQADGSTVTIFAGDVTLR